MRVREYLGVDPDRLSLVNGLDEGIMATRRRLSAADAGRRGGARPSSRSRRSRSSRSTRRSSAAAPVRVAPNPDFSFPLDARARGDHAEHAGRVPHEPEQPDRRADAARGDSRDRRRACRRSAVVFVDEAYAEFSGDQLHPRARRVPERRSSAARSRRRSAWPACASARSPAHPDALEPIRLAVPVYSVNIAAVVAVQAALAGSRLPATATCAQVERVEGAALRRLRSARAALLEERRQLRAGPRRRSRRGARAAAPPARGIYLRDRSHGAGLRRLPPHHRRHRRAHTPRASRVMEEVLCAARVIDRRTTETQIALALALEGKGTVPGAHRHPVPRSHARAVRAPRRVRPDGDRDRRSRRRSAPHGRGSRHRARRGRVEGARRPPRHQPRRLFRDADGRNAGGGRDRSRRPAAHGGRSEGRRCGGSAICRPSSCTTSSKGFAIGARANVHVKVMYGRSSHHKIEAVFKAFARALRVACAKDKRLARMLPSTKGLL